MKQKTISIKKGTGKDADLLNYTLQHPGIRWFYETSDECMDPCGLPNQVSTINAYFDHVVVQPKLSFKDFDEDKGKEKALTINGNDYIVVNPGVEKLLSKITETMGPRGLKSIVLEREWVLKNCLKEKLTIEDFDDDFNALEQLVGNALNFVERGESIFLLQDLMMECDNFLRGND